MEQPVYPWERILWNDDYQQVIFRNWGLFYTHTLQPDKAAIYYDKALEIKQDDEKVLYYRSMCKRNMAQTREALDDVMAAAEIDKNSVFINMGICDALYELNRFEDCKVELHDNFRKFSGRKVDWFRNRIEVVEDNFNDSIGYNLGPFILENEKHFYAVLESRDRATETITQPLWKILRDQGKCDVLSILEKEELLLSPLEIARRERAFKVFNQIYFNKTWIDALFLKNLQKHEELLPAHAKVSTPFLYNLVTTKYAIVRNFLKMLQARSPLYNEIRIKCPDKRVYERHHTKFLNWIQYQTRRNMLTILRTIRQLRADEKLQKLSNYIEEVMGDYIVLKTYRVMPWKFEFINEVYSTLALAHADTYVMRENFFLKSNSERKMKLLRLSIDKGKDRPAQFTFGDRSTYQEADAPDFALMTYKKFQSRLEKRLRFVKFSIEKVYILHEIARSHLINAHYDECCSVARKAMEETKHCNNTLWQFLNCMLIVKSHASLHKVERCREALDEALLIAERLHNPNLTEFVNLCRYLNEDELNLKKRTQSVESMRKRKSKQSLTSREMFSSDTDTATLQKPSLK